MKFEVERNTLAEAVTWVARSIQVRPTNPVLAGMHLTVTHGQLTVSAFDYEVSAQTIVPVTEDEDGSVLVPGRLLAEIIRALPAHPVKVTTRDGRVRIKCGSSVFTVSAFPADEFPALPALPAPAGTVGADLLAAAITQVAMAASKDDTLPALTGVQMKFMGDTMTLAATDRYRLAVRELPWEPAHPGIDTTVLVPAQVIVEVARSLTSATEVTIALPGDGDGVIGFGGGGRQLTTRLLSEEYPPYEKLLSLEFSAVAELPAAPFTEAVKRVSVVSELNTPVRLIFNVGQLTLETGNGDEVQATETMETVFGGKDLQIAFNPRYLLDGLTAVGSGTAQISFTTPAQPAMLTSKQGEEPADFRCIIVPLRQ